MNSSEIKNIFLMRLVLICLEVIFFRKEEDYEKLKQAIMDLPEELYNEIHSFAQEKQDE